MITAVDVGDGGPPPSPTGRVRCPVLVGTSGERDFLVRKLDRTADGQGGLVTVLGPAGIGKTRLVEEVRDTAARRGMTVLDGRAVDRSIPTAYRPVAEAVLPVLRPEDGPDDPQLAPFRPALAALLPDRSTDRQPDLALTEALARLLAAIADDGCLLVLEDLHWADPETLDVVEDLAHRLADRPVLCVATVRTGVNEDLERRVRVLGERRVADTVELTPLDRAELGEMVERSLGQGSVPAAVTAFVWEHADGIPLFVEELLDGLVTDGALVEEDGRWEIAGRLTPRVPVTFAQTVQRRLDRLPEDHRPVIQAAAVVGRQVDVSLLPAATGAPRPEVLEALRRAVDVGLLVDDEGEGGLRFRHALARDAIVDRMLPPVRSEIARQALDALDAADAPEANNDLVADLAVEAGDTDRAVQALLDMARESLQRGALSSCDRAVQRARNLTGEPDVLLAIEELAAHAAALRGHVRRAEQRAQRVLADPGRRLQDSESHRVRFEAVLARTAVAGGRWEEAEEHAQQARSRFDPDTMSPELDARLTALAAQIAASRGKMDEAGELASTVVDGPSDQLDAVTARCEALEILGRCARNDDLDEAEDLFERGLQLAEQHHLPLWRARALHELGTIDLQRWSMRRDRLVAARDAATQIGAVGITALAELHLCATGIVAWEPSRALEHGRRCVEISREHQLATLAAGLVHLGAAHGLAGDGSAMRATVEEADAAGGDAPEIAAGIPGKARMGLALRRGDLESACGHLDDAVEILRHRHDPSFPFWGLWALLRTRIGRDGAAAREQARHLGGMGIAHNEVCVGLAEAVHAGGSGRTEEAADRVAELEDRPPLGNRNAWRWVLLTAIGEAGLADDWGDGAAWLREATAGFDSQGMSEPASRCRRSLREAGLPAPRYGGSGEAVPPALAADGVTSREVEVLRLLTEELSNPEIAERLHISRRTVERHVSNLLTKTGCADRHEVAGCGSDLLDDATG